MAPVPTVCIECGATLGAQAGPGQRAKVCSAACKRKRKNRQGAERHPAWRATIKKRLARVRAADPDGFRAAQREYSRKSMARPGGREAQRDATKAWKRSHPDAVKNHLRNRYARKKSAAGRCTSRQITARIQYYSGKCWIPGCGKEGTQVDHVIPLARGGTHWPSNLRPVCAFHNSSRKATPWKQYLERMSA